MPWLIGKTRVRLDNPTATPSGHLGSFEERAAILASGMDHGVREGYEKLDELLRKEG